MKPTNNLNAARGKTAATIAHPPGLKAPRTPDYRGQRFEVNRLDGTTTTYIPLIYLAAEWDLDYHTLRNFVRDDTDIRSEKQAFHHDFRGRQTDFIVICEADLLRLYHCLRCLSVASAVRSVLPPAANDPIAPTNDSPGAGGVRNGSGETRTQPPAPEEPYGEST